jgi:hypothetical protein
MIPTTRFREASDVLRRAVAQGVIDPTPRAFDRKRFETISLFQPLMRQLHVQATAFRAKTSWLGKQNTWVAPPTRRYQISYEPDNAPVVQTAAIAWLVELARWPVPDGNFGVVKSFEQYLADRQTTYSTFNSWGNPYATAPNRIEWYFRLSPVSEIGVTPWLNVTGLSAIAAYLPGRPYTDLPATNSLWYPASSPQSANIHLPVPGGYALRVFLLAPPIAGLQAAVKLSGTIQSELGIEAQNVARMSW